jgi:hypothetical protein
MKATLLVGKTLKEGSSLYSENLKYALELQKDGNVFIFNYPNGLLKSPNERNAIWSSNSASEKHKGFVLTLNKNGAITVLNSKNKVHWESNSKIAKVSNKLFLKLLDNGNLVILDKTAKPVWDLYTVYYHASKNFVSNSLESGQSIGMGRSLISKNNKFSLDVQYDGNLVIYEYPNGIANNSNRKPVWFTDVPLPTPANSPFRLKLNKDGNLVLNDNHKKTVWSSGSQQKNFKNAKYKLVLNKNGNLLILDKSGKTIWTNKK